MTATLLPSALQAFSLAAVLILALGFSVIGAALGGRDRVAEADLLVGWSVVAGLFVVLGGWLDLPLTRVALAAVLVVVASAAVLWRRRQAPLEPGHLKVLAWMAPLLAVTASMDPSQWDEFSQWLPNARYLVMFDAFPGAGHPASDSVFPGYPPSLTAVLYLVSRMTGQFVDSAAPWFNLLLLVSAGRMMARMLRGDGGRVGWTLALLGTLGVTALGTTFVPKLVLSAYADTATTAAMGMSAVLGLRLLRGGAIPGRVIQFAAVFALLPMTKQGNFALMALLLGALGIEALLAGGRRGRALAALAALALGLVPAVLAALAWRAHLSGQGGDMAVRAWADWQWELLPAILTSMMHVSLSKGGYFGFGLLVVGLLALGRLRGPELALARVFALAFLGYNLFLVVVYLAILGGYESANAASFWRYNTHLGLLEMLSLALLAGRWLPPLPRLGKAVLVVGGLAAVIVPFALPKLFRFDRQPTRLHAMATIADMAGLLPADPRMMVIDVRGTGYYSNLAEYHLGFGRQVVANINVFGADQLDAIMAQVNPAHLWVRTTTPAVSGRLGLELDERSSHLLRRAGSGWAIVKSWPYPAGMDPAAEKE